MKRMGVMHTKLNQTEREQLSRWKAEGISYKACARRLKRSVSTIGRELKRNGFKNNRVGEYIYEPRNAQSQAEKRKEKHGKQNSRSRTKNYTAMF